MPVAKKLNFNKRTISVLLTMFGLAGGILLYNSWAASPNLVKNSSFESAAPTYLKPSIKTDTRLYKVLPAVGDMKMNQWHFYINPVPTAPLLQRTGRVAVSTQHRRVDATRVKGTAHTGLYVLRVTRRSGHDLGYRGIAQQMVALPKTSCKSNQRLAYKASLYTHHVSGGRQYINVVSHGTGTANRHPGVSAALATANPTPPTPPTPPGVVAGVVYDRTFTISGPTSEYWRHTEFSGYVKPNAAALLLTINSETNSVVDWDDIEFKTECVKKSKGDEESPITPVTPTDPPTPGGSGNVVKVYTWKCYLRKNSNNAYVTRTNTTGKNPLSSLNKKIYSHCVLQSVIKTTLPTPPPPR